MEKAFQLIGPCAYRDAVFRRLPFGFFYLSAFSPSLFHGLRQCRQIFSLYIIYIAHIFIAYKNNVTRIFARFKEIGANPGILEAL